MPRPKKQASANGAESGHVNKAELIRQTARSLPRPVRPRDVIAKIKSEHGQTVTSPQVSKILKGLGQGRGPGARRSGDQRVEKAAMSCRGYHQVAIHRTHSESEAG